MKIKRVGKFVAWATVVVLAAATTVGVMFVARLGYGRLGTHLLGRLGVAGWLLVLAAALAPWWALCAVVARREWARVISDPGRPAR